MSTGISTLLREFASRLYDEGRTFDAKDCEEWARALKNRTLDDGPPADSADDLIAQLENEITEALCSLHIDIDVRRTVNEFLGRR